MIRLDRALEDRSAIISRGRDVGADALLAPTA